MSETETRWPAILRGGPSAEGWSPPGAPYRGRSLSSQVSIYWHAAGDVNADQVVEPARQGDTLGLLAVLIARGRLVFHGLLIIPDDLDRAARDALRRWGRRHPVDTAQGPMPWRVVTRKAFFAPRATREHQPWAFVPNAYNRAAGPVVGVDQGRTIGLVAEHVVERTGRNLGSWEVWLPGWGYPRPDKKDFGKESLNRPPLRVSSRRAGWSVQFGPCDKGFGTRGATFLDVLSAAYSLDADRAAGFVEHARNFDITADALPVTVSVDAHGAALMAAAVSQVHALALRLDEVAGEWFTRSEDRRGWVRRLPLGRLQSPAAITDHLLRQVGVDPPLRRFPLTEAESAAWWESFHGAWNDDVPALRGRSFGAVAVDLSSAYPLVAHHLGWWDVMTADRLERRSKLRELRTLCAQAAKDPSVILDPTVWARLGLTVCEVIPNGEPFPIAVDDPHRPDGRTETVPVFAKGRTMFYGWPDVVAAAILSRRVPEIVNAMQLFPVGRQTGLRKHVPVLRGLTLDTTDDPAVGLVRRRREAKAAGDTTTAALLHAAVNSLVSGNPSRLDDVRRKVGNEWTRQEKSGPWTFAPLAVTVTGGARLLLAILARQVADLGSTVAYRDTDSSIIPASPEGGVSLTLADGSTMRELSYPEVDGLLAGFGALSPEPDAWPVWKRDPKPDEAPMKCIVFGLKRHVEYRDTDDALELVEWTESTLGGRWSDPAAMRGRCAEGGQAWSKAAVEREVRYAAAKLHHPSEALRDRAPWDATGDLPFPTLRRLAVTSAALLSTLPEALCARVGTRYIEAVMDDIMTQGVGSVVALDPGGSLTGWQGLRWLNRSTGEPVWITTDRTDYRATLLESLAARAGQYGRRPERSVVESVTVTPLSVRYAGRVSPVIDAQEDGMQGDLRRFRVSHTTDHCLGPGQREALVALARSMPRADFAKLAGTTPRVATQLARGELPRTATVRGVLAELRRSGAAWTVPGARQCQCGCGTALDTGQRSYVNDTHQHRAEKRRYRAARSQEPGDTRSERKRKVS